MKLISVFILSALLFAGCSKHTTQPQQRASTISVKKDSIAWDHEGVLASYNETDDMIHVMTAKDNETFIISFKKGSIPVDGIIKDYGASVLIAPAKGSAAISAAYRLDSTKSNKLRLLILETLENRVACDFVLYLKKEDQYPDGVATHIFQGRFDVRFNSFSLE